MIEPYPTSGGGDAGSALGAPAVMGPSQFGFRQNSGGVTCTRRASSWLFLLAWLVLGGCSLGEATNEVLQELPSPDGTMRIVLFCRSAGATTGFNTQMSVLELKQELPRHSSGNACIIDNGAPRASWKEDGSILVLLDRGCRVFKKEASVRGVRIEYRNQ